MLYLALLFPELAWESFAQWRTSEHPWALIDLRRIALCNPRAGQKGVQVGQSVSAALALEPDLHLQPRQLEAELKSLRQRADWALNYSAEVSLQDHHGLLLEIASALRYFGGLETLLERVRADLQCSVQVFSWAVAPTPMAAWWGVQFRSGWRVLQLADLPGLIGQLPIQVMNLPAETHDALLGVGILRVADCQRMPRHALAHRFGPGLPILLDQALGARPDPRVAHCPENGFSVEQELQAPTEDYRQLQMVMTVALPALVLWVSRQGREVRRIALTLMHDRQPSTYLPIGFAGSARLEHLQLVIEQHLARLVLPHAVIALRLQLLEWAECQHLSASFLPTAPSRLQQGQELLERLRARLGDDAVTGLKPCADHRPERAWSYAEPGGLQDTGQVLRRQLSPMQPAARLSHARTGLPPRPLWLLESPKDLGTGTLPLMGRPLALLSGPERIESGWWDGEDVARDYFVAEAFVAEAQGGPQYWVYRDCRGEMRWFLQGVFA